MLVQLEPSYDVAGKERFQIVLRLCHGGSLRDGQLSHNDGIGDTLLLVAQLKPSFVLVLVVFFVCSSHKTNNNNINIKTTKDESPD